MTVCVRSLMYILSLVAVLALVPSGVAAQDASQPQPQPTPTSQPTPADTVSAQSTNVDSAKPLSPEAQYRLAQKLLKTDVPAAAKWFERAALQGHGKAAYQLGRLQTDAKPQVEWYSMAAAVGVPAAQYALGEAYLKGRGTAREPAWGVSWFERAARGGNVKAQYALGMSLVSGVLGPVPREEALVWLRVAQKNGAPNTDLIIDLLQSRMSADAIAMARTRAASWTNDPKGDAKTRAITRFAQYALGRLGFDAGMADGLSGKHTQGAISAFRRAEKLGSAEEGSGLDARTLDALRERLSVLKR